MRPFSLKWSDLPKFVSPQKSPMQLLYECRVYDEHWKLKKTTGLMNSHCFLLNFFRYLEASYNHINAGTGYGPLCKAIDGTTEANYTYFDGGLANLQVGYRSSICSMSEDDTFGLVVGLGTTAPTPGDYVMENQLTHGVSTNTLFHYNTSESGAVSSETSCYLTCQRIFGNVSGGTINVREMGLQYKGWYGNGQYDDWRVLVLRDVIDVSVADSDFLTCMYMFKTTT